MSRESAKAKYTRLSGDPEVGYISPDDVMDAIDIMYDDMTNGPVVDADVAADADIDRSKIAGTALTADSMGVFNVKDYGAVGDNTTDDTAAIQAAITAGAGAEVHFPPGVYKIDGALTVPDWTVLRGSGAYEAGSPNGYTRLRFTTDNNSFNAITCGDYVTIDGLMLRGTHTYDYTTTAIVCPSITLRNVSIGGFYFGVGMTNGYYSNLDRCEFTRNAVHIKLTGCYDVNIYGCAFADDPVWGFGTNTCIYADTVRSLNIFGGSIEGYRKGITAGSGSGVHLYGVYFETGVDMNAIGVYLGATAGVNLNMTGCTIYLNGHAPFVYAQDGATETSITSSGNFFCSGGAGSNAGTAFSLSADLSCRNYLRGDNWAGVNDPAANYIGGFLGPGSVANSIIEFPAGFDGSGWGPEPLSFQGHHVSFAEGAKIIAGQNTGLAIGSLHYEKLGFLGATPVTRQTVTGAKGGNAALGSLITALAAFGLILDSTS